LFARGVKVETDFDIDVPPQRRSIPLTIDETHVIPAWAIADVRERMADTVNLGATMTRRLGRPSPG
jgi:hypothetical protein